MKKEITIENVVSEDCEQIRDIMSKVYHDEQKRIYNF